MELNPTATTTINEWFKTTHWTTVLEAGRSDSNRAQDALARLCRAYWPPLYTYIRRLGRNREDAQDLTQEFFARVIAKDYLEAADPAKGRFRSFLLTALKRFLAKEYARTQRQKRGGGQPLFSLDEADAEERYAAQLADHHTPEVAFERRWASTLLEQVLARLAVEMAAEGKELLFRQLQPFLTGAAESTDYPEIARKLGLTEGTLRVNIHRLRQRYRDLLRLEVANTVGSPEFVDDEIRHLFLTAAQ
jgi:RNA polymerase sigma-70 factor (ECF subfamily)